MLYSYNTPETYTQNDKRESELLSYKKWLMCLFDFLRGNSYDTETEDCVCESISKLLSVTSFWREILRQEKR